VTDLSFDDLPLLPELHRAIREVGYEQPTPIQCQAIPPLLDGRDLIGIAQTGTGKTAAFALPILDALVRNRQFPGPRGARVLILTPTRELAAQIEDSFETYGRHVKVSRALIFGGVGQSPQVSAMSKGVDVLVATPGRLLDLMGQGHVRLDRLEVFVLDEADRMLDMGFIHDVRRVISTLPKDRQTLLFSATMPPEVATLAQGILRSPVRVEVAPQATLVERVVQQVLFVDKGNKRHLLRALLEQPAMDRALVFTRTKHGANKVAEDLVKASISAMAIHGNKSQSAREKALESFRDGRIRVLVATDIAARGIDIVGVSHVINFDLPNEPESYVHRIGRTARAGADGIALSFCDAEERLYLRDIERLIRQELPVDDEHPYHSEAARLSRLPPPTRESLRSGAPRSRPQPQPQSRQAPPSTSRPQPQTQSRSQPARPTDGAQPGSGRRRSRGGRHRGRGGVPSQAA
jgi:ATP-dependent RNA helicase RhlE